MRGVLIAVTVVSAALAPAQARPAWSIQQTPSPGRVENLLYGVSLLLLPFVSSAIVPAAKMGQGVRQFAEYQPFTPIIESLRGLLAGTPSGGYVAAALGWCAGIALIGYLWSRATFSKRA